MNVQAHDTETSILAACIRDNSLIDELQTRIAPAMFTMSRYGELWEVMCELRMDDAPVSPVEISIKAPSLASTMGDTIADLMFFSVGNVDNHVQRVIDNYVRGEVTRRLAEIQVKVLESVSVDEIFGDLEQLTSLAHQMDTSEGLHYANVEKYIADLKEKQKHPERAVGFLTGWQKFDSLTLGFKKRKLAVIGARTSIGKSAFAAEIIKRFMERNVRCGVFSLEMDEGDFIDRIVSNRTDIAHTKVNLGSVKEEERQEIEQTATDFIRKMVITDERNMYVDAIIAQIKRWNRTKGLDCVIIDYLQEIQEPLQRDDFAGEKLTRIVRKLRKCAKDCDVAIIALSQLNRDAEGSKKPTVANFAGSTGIENVADMTVLLHRDREIESDLMSVNIAKNRNGKTGEVNMIYNMSRQRIEETD